VDKPRPDDYRHMSPEERIKLVEQIYISYPRLEVVIKKIEHCHRHSKLSAEPECLLITGETGAGKTTLYKRYQQRFPRRVTEDGTVVPVLSVSIPVPATVKSMVTTLLVALGDPFAEKGTVVNQTLRLKRLLVDCGVELTILDDFQHFIDRDSSKVLQNVSDWLKDLLNETKIPVVLIGMPSSEQILEENKQLKRRFAARASLAPFGWDTPGEQLEFRKFLKVLDGRLPLLERSHLADTETAYLIYCATGGTVASVMKLVRRATSLALEQGCEKLTLEILARAYDERLAADDAERKNPFPCDTSRQNNKAA
jgi:type II secretory pathway predicted ATPase ExeA